jgi:uncharacterized protein (TIGR00661 family)
MKRVLVVPLDWGFGHATRCIPIIHALRTKQCEVILGGSGASLQLLKKEFPSLIALEFPGYAPTYPTNGSMVWQMIKQLPHFVSIIQKEHTFLQKMISTYSIDMVISDNRYGCWSSAVPSIFITHQSNILMPKRFGFLAPIVQYVNGVFMKKFTECWFPDRQGVDSIAGALTKVSPTIQHRFIGTLSRFTYKSTVEKQYDLVCVLSGPEPQRTMLEDLLVKQLDTYKGKLLFVRGITDERPWKGNFPCVPLLTSASLEEALLAAKVVLSRSGYSTVMDLARLGSNAILIPTPGQTEQEYLAKRLGEKNVVVHASQNQFILAEALERVQRTKGFTPESGSSTSLEEALNSVLT